jgi:integrase
MLVGYPTRQEWLNEYNEPGTRKILDASLKHFDRFLIAIEKKELEFFEYVRNTDEMELFRIIGKIKLQLTEKLSPLSSKYYLGHIMTWFKVNGVSISDTKFKRDIRWNKVHKELKYTPGRSEIQTIINNCTKLEYRLFYHFAVSTGARQSEIISLRKMDVDLNNDIPSVHFLAENTKTKQERYSFLTPECGDLLKKYYLSENIAPHEEIFKINCKALQVQFHNLRKKIGHTEQYNTGTAKLSIHRLRAYTKRQLSRNVSDDFAHLILGHAGNLATYDGDNIEGLRKDYALAVPDLTILEDNNTKQTNTKLEEQNNLLKQEIFLLKKKIQHDEYFPELPPTHTNSHHHPHTDNI